MNLEANVDRELAQEMESCRQLAAEPSDDSSDLSALQSRLQTTIEEERGPLAALRARPTSQRLALVMSLTALVTAASAALSPRPDLAAYPPTRLLLALAVLACMTAAASWRLLRPLHRPPAPAWQDRLLLAAGFALPVTLILWPLDHAGAPPGQGASFVAECVKCFGFGAAFGVPLLVLAVALRRARVSGGRIASLAGVAAGVAGLLALLMHCPISAPHHIVVGHASVLVVLAALATLWRR